jgi:hypothetical protein
MKKATVSKVKREKIGEILPLMPDHHGLCICCKSEKTCTFTRDPGKMILQCEEFDGITQSPLKIVPKARSVTQVRRKASSNHFKGLCALCLEQQVCTYPKPEGGVWHCEEYR